jgi:Leucine-rich repeat (LRR) protein
VTRTVVAWLGKLVGEDLSGDMTEVFLIGNQVSDAGLAHLRGLTQLKGLNLSSTQVTDAGLEHLRGLTRLTYLHLSNTQVTDASVNELKKVLPNLYVGR